MRAKSLAWVKIFFARLKLASGIQRHPEMYSVAVDEFRRAPIRRFPFEIFYESTVDSITIYSVFHCSQDPQKWRKRLGY